MPSQNSAVLSIGTSRSTRTNSRPDKGALPPGVVGEVRADQKPDQGTWDLHDQEATSAGQGQAAHRPQIGWHPDAQRIAAALRARNRQRHLGGRPAPAGRWIPAASSKARYRRWRQRPRSFARAAVVCTTLCGSYPGNDLALADAGRPAALTSLLAAG